MKIGEAIRTAIQNLGIPHEASRVSEFVTISLGVATADAEFPLSHEDLIKRADSALYAAKEKGRNRVEYDDGQP